MDGVTLDDLPSAKKVTKEKTVKKLGSDSKSPAKKRPVKTSSRQGKTSMEPKEPSNVVSKKTSTHCSVKSFTASDTAHRQDTALDTSPPNSMNQNDFQAATTSRPETSQGASSTRQERQVERLPFKSEHLSPKHPSSLPSSPKMLLQPFRESPPSNQTPSAQKVSSKHAPVSRSHTTMNSKPGNFADRCRQLKAEEGGGGPQSHAPVGRTYSGPITQREVREAEEESQPLPDHMEDTISIMFHQYNGAMKDYKDIVSDALGTGKVTKRELTFQRFCELIDDEKGTEGAFILEKVTLYKQFRRTSMKEEDADITVRQSKIEDNFKDLV